jgi:hypothetical protein
MPTGVEIAVHTTPESVPDHVSSVLDQTPAIATNVTSTPTGQELTAYVMPTGLVMTVPSMMRLAIIVVTDVVDQATLTVLNVLDTLSELTLDTVNVIPNGVEQDVPTGLVCVIHVAQPVTAHFSSTVKLARVLTQSVVQMLNVLVKVNGADLTVNTTPDPVQMHATAATARMPNIV